MAKPHLLASFLSTAKSVHSTGGGTKETSYYTAINNLLDGAGHLLLPKVRCVMQLKNLGAGNPDGGLFTADQFDRNNGSVARLGINSFKQITRNKLPKRFARQNVSGRLRR